MKLHLFLLLLTSTTIVKAQRQATLRALETLQGEINILNSYDKDKGTFPPPNKDFQLWGYSDTLVTLHYQSEQGGGYTSGSGEKVFHFNKRKELYLFTSENRMTNFEWGYNFNSITTASFFNPQHGTFFSDKILFRFSESTSSTQEGATDDSMNVAETLHLPKMRVIKRDGKFHLPYSP